MLSLTAVVAAPATSPFARPLVASVIGSLRGRGRARSPVDHREVAPEPAKTEKLSTVPAPANRTYDAETRLAGSRLSAREATVPVPRVLGPILRRDAPAGYRPLSTMSITR
jgi:hypothetical protein